MAWSSQKIVVGVRIMLSETFKADALLRSVRGCHVFGLSGG